MHGGKTDIMTWTSGADGRAGEGMDPEIQGSPGGQDIRCNMGTERAGQSISVRMRFSFAGRWSSPSQWPTECSAPVGRQGTPNIAPQNVGSCQCPDQSTKKTEWTMQQLQQLRAGAQKRSRNGGVERGEGDGRQFETQRLLGPMGNEAEEGL